MKKIVKLPGYLLLTILLLSSCGTSTESAAGYSPVQIAQAIISSQDNISALEPLLPDDEYYVEYLQNIYRLSAEKIKDGVIYYASGMQANEIAVFILNDVSDVTEIKDALVKYKERRTDAFMGYAPEQAAILENSIVVSHGDHVAILICEQPQKAESVFIACFSNQLPPINYEEVLIPENEKETVKPELDVEPDEPSRINSESVSEATNYEPVSNAAVNEKPVRDAAVNEKPVSGEAVDNETANDEADSSGTTGDETDNDEDVADESGDQEATDSEAAKDEPANNTATDNTETDKTPSNNTEANKEKNEQGDVYNPSAIINAWQSGDKTNLSNKNRSILDACIEIIAAVTNDKMSIYEKELAIHDWIIDWVSYDEEANSNSPHAKPDPDNDNPYGAIFQKKAICSGYTSTFQLFMDMLGIECITVNGIYASTGEEHAWNMVRIDGEWYCVDTTWDDPIGGFVTTVMKHRYFNVTSRFMRETRHQWDDSSTPIADSGKLYFE